MLSRRRIAEYAADELQAGKSVKPLALHMAAYLVEQKQADKIDLLLSDIEAALSNRHGVSTVRVSTARPLTVELRKALTEFVRKAENAAQVIIVDEVLDKSLIGGATVSTPSGFFDASVQYQLQQLKAKGER